MGFPRPTSSTTGIASSMTSFRRIHPMPWSCASSRGMIFRVYCRMMVSTRKARPLRDYFRKPGWIRHAIAWINLHSKFGFFLQRALLSWNPGASRSVRGPKNWWSNPEVAAQAENATAFRRCRSLFQAIDEECRQHGTKLCILVVGPVANYRSKDGQSPLARILAKWQIDVPVIDVAIKARARRDWASLVFPFDGHLNESGHDYVAQEAASPLRMVLDDSQLSTRR